MHHIQSDSEQNACRVHAAMSVVEDRFATEPTIPIQPTYQQLDEEELHTLFEQAISDRLVAVSERLRRISGLLTNVESKAVVQCATQRGVASCIDPREQQGVIVRTSWLGNTWQRSVIFAGLALMLVMVGFDLMGVLVLQRW